MAPRTVLGIDLGGALQATTGFAVLTGSRQPKLGRFGVLEKATTAAAAEETLLELIDHERPDVVAVDAPLTLPPCLSCPSFCRGPSPGSCELRAAQLVWAEDGNPVTERLCEVLLRPEIGGGKPLPTMRIGQIAGRGVALARRLSSLRYEEAGPLPRLLEVYPAASVVRLRRIHRGLRGKSSGASFRRKLIGELKINIAAVEDDGEIISGHVYDALLAAYTGWLPPDLLDAPPDHHNAASGWIWLPSVA
jgi:predicted RNase H-like nuclease